MKVSDAYNEWSSQYDTNKNRTRDLEKVAALATIGSSSFDSILELGCGTGKNTEWLATKCRAMTALDFSAGMLEMAKKKVNAAHVTFATADLTGSWPVASNAYSIITCSLVLEHIENLNHIFSEAARVLMPGGLFYLCELHPFKQYSGTKARFERDKQVVELPVFIHHLSDYVQSAIASRFLTVELKEWFDEGETKMPRLVSFVFQKPKDN